MLLNNFRVLLLLALFGVSSTSFAQCFDIETILVAACDSGGATPDEGFNEMVRFKVGPTAINTSTMTVSFPSNTWQGLIQNATTAAKVIQLNNQIAALGGCAQLLQPTGGVLPANAKVILVTSQNFSVSANVFGPISQNMYIIFQNNTTQTGGHFGNFGATSPRTLTISFGACTDTVTYDRSLLVTTAGVPGGGDGSSVNFTPAGVASYFNLGCFAPIDPFTVDAGTVSSTPCAGTTINLVGSAQGYTAVQWTATSGTFGSANSLSSSYTIPSSATGNVQLNLTATNACGATVSDNVTFSVATATLPNFSSTLSLCTGATAPTLNATSPNGIAGTWSPATISNTTGNTYVFTPNAGQCATTANTVVTVSSSITPDFSPSLAVCSGATAPTLNATSPNGISGTWNPSTISNTSGNTYVFTPNAGQCATTANTVVTVSSSITPDFAPTLAVCSGATAPTLNATSPNGISGTWSPATISNTTGNTYVFTPNSGQCATTANTVVSITAQTTPNFAPTLAVCSGAAAPALNASSPNGISGTWNPATISNTTGNTYVFTPTAGQCATTANMVVTVASSITPNFTPTLSLCSGATAPALNATSPNGISGTWNPATISNTAGNTYVFTPNSGQCATTANTVVSINAQTVPNFATTLALCTGATAPALNATSPNGISGTWNPATISNSAGNTYVFTPTAGQCATTANTVVTITVQTTPNFATTLALCSGATAPALNATSPNGISGTWNPATISNTTGNTYVFTPNAGQCATTANTVVTITVQTTPNFATTLALCSGSTAPALNASSPNGIAGTWSPSTISNTTGNTYVFTPNAGQCATTANTVVSITAQTVPNFATTWALCSSATAPTLNATSPNGISGTWNPATISNSVGNTYVFTPNSGQCATTANTVVTVSSSITPNFTPTLSLCSGATAPTLNATSPNGISGTWSPATINNTTGNTYVFTPTAGQCATTANTVVSITAQTIPNFTTNLALCSGSTAPNLNATSPNGISGTWSPATISSTTGNTYVFTPNAGQCATTANTVVSITAQTVPNFATTWALCSGATAPTLNATSPNGISGTWNPSTISNTTGNTYVFTPTSGQCATTANTVVTVSSSITPDFAPTLAVCSGATAPTLNATSPNGISGSWSPATISNTTGNMYVFTPTAGQCANTANTVVTVSSSITPDFVSTLAVCSGVTAPTLNATSPNGISGTWSPATISNTTGNTYVFTPNAGQCATTANTVVAITAQTTPNFAPTLALCSGATAPALNATSPNGISGTWNPATISNTTGNTYVFTPNTGQCATTANLVVSVSPNSVQTATYAICLDATGQATLPALIDTGLLASAYTFTWTKDGIALPDTTSSILVTAAGSYEAIATNLSSSCIVTLTATVQTVPKATAVASVQYDFASEQLIHLAVTGGQGPFSYQLNGGNSQLSPDFTIYQGGDYQIHITEPNGCNTIDLEVTALFYPKFFTPNGDGFNDSWNISGDSLQDHSELYIFDRMGKLLKQLAPNSAGWNGTYNGHPLPSNDYWFLLKYISTTGQAKEFKANFSLKR